MEKNDLGIYQFWQQLIITDIDTKELPLIQRRECFGGREANLTALLSQVRKSFGTLVDLLLLFLVLYLVERQCHS